MFSPGAHHGHHLRRYILGFPGDTPERIARDIRNVQQELPVDLLEFFILTPAAGLGRPPSAAQDGVWDGPRHENNNDSSSTFTPATRSYISRVAGSHRKAGDLYYSPSTSRRSSAAPRRHGIKPGAPPQSYLQSISPSAGERASAAGRLFPPQIAAASGRVACRAKNPLDVLSTTGP